MLLCGSHCLIGTLTSTTLTRSLSASKAVFSENPPKENYGNRLSEFCCIGHIHIDQISSCLREVIATTSAGGLILLLSAHSLCVHP